MRQFEYVIMFFRAVSGDSSILCIDNNVYR